MTSIQPITEIQQTRVRKRSHDLIRQAATDLGETIPEIEIRFDLNGRSAGMYCSRIRQRWIRYNPYLFAKYFEDNLEYTVPHEVAHYLADILFGHRKIAPHGEEWQAMMKLLGYEPSTTHRFNLEGVPVRKQRRHLYRCGCRNHLLSTTRHNRIQREQRRHYVCKSCGEVLSYVKEDNQHANL